VAAKIQKRMGFAGGNAGKYRDIFAMTAKRLLILLQRNALIAAEKIQRKTEHATIYSDTFVMDVKGLFVCLGKVV